MPAKSTTAAMKSSTGGGTNNANTKTKKSDTPKPTKAMKTDTPANNGTAKSMKTEKTP